MAIAASRSSLRWTWRVPREPENHQAVKVMSERDRGSQRILGSRSPDRTQVHTQDVGVFVIG
jgi:hypothetical protein